jgi:hypothetical protein
MLAVAPRRGEAMVAEPDAGRLQSRTDRDGHDHGTLLSQAISESA